MIIVICFGPLCLFIFLFTSVCFPLVCFILYLLWLFCLVSLNFGVNKNALLHLQLQVLLRDYFHRAQPLIYTPTFNSNNGDAPMSGRATRCPWTFPSRVSCGWDTDFSNLADILKSKNLMHCSSEPLPHVWNNSSHHALGSVNPKAYCCIGFSLIAFCLQNSYCCDFDLLMSKNI